jgi:hypothetical protein
VLDPVRDSLILLLVYVDNDLGRCRGHCEGGKEDTLGFYAAPRYVPWSLGQCADGGFQEQDEKGSQTIHLRESGLSTSSAAAAL